MQVIGIRRRFLVVVRPRDILCSRADFKRRKRLSAYLPVLIFTVLIVAFGVVSLAVARLVRPSRPDAVKLANYECGAEPIGSAWVQFPVGFYLVALLFIVFDTLAVFLFPWALVLKSIGLRAFWVMAAFVGIIGLGWVYAYREGVLEWR
ncbi:MAG: NADH-quinone oxidoreductase subunit A [Candidatus Rokuibacteriota bacterium]|nr:MAG: NADH-quinone oxidoreductase subunit A [Candidatus Rokubacteria bacterium]